MSVTTAELFETPRVTWNTINITMSSVLYMGFGCMSHVYTSYVWIIAKRYSVVLGINSKKTWIVGVKVLSFPVWYEFTTSVSSKADVADILDSNVVISVTKYGKAPLVLASIELTRQFDTKPLYLFWLSLVFTMLSLLTSLFKRAGVISATPATLNTAVYSEHSIYSGHFALYNSRNTPHSIVLSV